MKKIKYLNKKKKQKKTFFTKVSTNEFLDFIVKKKDWLYSYDASYYIKSSFKTWGEIIPAATQSNTYSDTFTLWLLLLLH